MKLEITESIYNAKRKYLKLRTKIAHDKYGTVLCFFRLNSKEAGEIKLTNAFVEGMVIPLQKHKALLMELENDVNLLDEVRKIGLDIIKSERAILEKKRIEKLGNLKNLTLDYLSVLATTSVVSKEVKRKGSKLSEITEEQYERHSVIIMVKFKEIKEEYELKITYSTKHGYRLKVTDSDTNKLSLTEIIDDDISNKILYALKNKVDFLP